MLPVFLRSLGDLSRELPWISRDSGFFFSPPLSDECHLFLFTLGKSFRKQGFFKKKKDSYNLSLIAPGGDGAFERVLARGVRNLNTNLRKNFII